MIRPIRSDDRSAVRSLQEHLEYTDGDLLDAAIDGPFLGRVATDGSRVVGYAIALPGTTATVSELVVAPDARRSGHGRALVEAIAAATDAEALVVTTPTDNDAARRFYSELGFEADERLSGFYADGTDASRLVRRE